MKVERLCKGVITESVPGPFDSENPEQPTIRQEAMEHFEVPVE